MAGDDKGFVKIKPLTLYSNDGTLTVSIKNGYPRFTFFPKENDPSKKFNYITAPMGIKTFGVIADAIKEMALVREDRKRRFVFTNKDPKTQEKFIQAVMIIARRGTKVLIAMKRNLEGDPFTFEIVDNGYAYEIDDDGKKNDEVTNRESAKWYSNYMYYISEKADDLQEIDGGMPNSQRTKEKEESKSNVDPDDQL